MLALALLLPLPLAAPSDVWVVDDDGGPGVDFTDVAPAVAAAQPGDVVLVRAGTYGDVAVAHGITLVGSGAATCASLRIEGVPEGEQVVVRGLDVVNPADTALFVSANAGAIWLERCSFVSTADFWSGSPGTQNHGAIVKDSIASFHGCLLRGGTGLFGGGGGLWLWDGAEAYVYDCVLEGGPGDEPGGSGGSGASAEGFLFTSGSSFQGGNGGDSLCLGFGDGYTGSGGYGIYVTGTTHALQSSFQKGVQGDWFCGPPPAPTFDVFGPLQQVSGLTARGMTTTSPVAEGEAVDVALAGAPGDLAILAFSSRADALFLPALHGALVLEPPLAFLTAGALDASGQLALSLPTGLLPPGVEGLALLGQAAFFTPAGPVFLGPGASVLIVDAAIAL